MSRRRPELKNWDSGWLRHLQTSDPEAWVLQALSAIERTEVESYSEKYFRPLTFGEIREAIRRELVSRGAPEERAYKLAAARTLRGTHSLEKKGALARSSRGYRLKERWAWAETISREVHAMAAGRARFGQGVEHDRRDHHVLQIAFRDRSGKVISLTLPVGNGR